MKVLSMHNPQAVLAVYGYKTIETKAMDTTHRGWLAIHATREWPAEYRVLMDVWPTNDCLVMINNERIDRGWEPWFRSDLGWPSTKHPDRELGDEIADRLPKGAIVGLVYVARTESTQGITERWNRRANLWKLDTPDYNDVPAWEPSFGEYTEGRRAWWLCNPIPLRTPIPVNGWPGIWTTGAASKRDQMQHDVYEARIGMDLGEQGIVLDDQSAALQRIINRRGVVEPATPRSM